MQNPPLILGSSSAARRELLTRMKIPFSVDVPDVDETPLAGESAEALVKRLAELKAVTVAQRHPDALIIGCDQVGILDGVILGKPLNFENAVQQLRFKSGKVVRFHSALCLYDSRTQQYQSTIEVNDVSIRDLSDELIKAYLEKEKPYHCAGSIQVEGLGIALIDRISGDDYTALIGLPLIRLSQMLEKVGFDIFA